MFREMIISKSNLYHKNDAKARKAIPSITMAAITPPWSEKFYDMSINIWKFKNCLPEHHKNNHKMCQLQLPVDKNLIAHTKHTEDTKHNPYKRRVTRK